MLVAEPRNTPIAAELVSINRATTLNMPEQNARNNLARRSLLSQEEHPAGATLNQCEKEALTPRVAPLCLPLLHS